MAIDFFDREVTRLQDMFNEVFGPRKICHLGMRLASIKAIISLKMLGNAIDRAKDKKDVRPEIKQFMHNKKVVENFFDNQLKAISNIERRHRGTISKPGNVSRRTAV
jgi:hypothetical protein